MGRAPVPTGNLLLPVTGLGSRKGRWRCMGLGRRLSRDCGEGERLSALWSPRDQSTAPGHRVETCPETPLHTAHPTGALSLPRAQVQGLNACSLFPLVSTSESWKEGRTALWSTYNVPDITAAAAKSLQSCPTLCDPRDGSPPGSPIPGILQARTLEWVAISFSNA